MFWCTVTYLAAVLPVTWQQMVGLITVRFGSSVRIGIVVKKSKSESEIRFLNRNRILNWSKFGFGSSLGSQNHESNRRFTVLDCFGRFWAVRSGSIRFGQKKFKFFWLNRNRTGTEIASEPKPPKTETVPKPLKILFKFDSYELEPPNRQFRPETETDPTWDRST